jgi:hypothetical protein
MKHTFISSRSVVASLALSVTMLLAGFSATAKDEKQDSTINISPIVEYVGSNENSSLYSLEVNSEKPVKYSLVVSDAEGTELLSQEFEAAKITRYFKLIDDGNIDIYNVTFTVRSLPNGVSHVFKVSSDLKFEKKVVVVKK